MAILYNAGDDRAQEWRSIFAEALPELDFRLWPSVGEQSDIRYLITWIPPKDVFDICPKLEVVLTISAGVDQLNFSSIPGHVSVVRLLGSDLADTMAEYVAFSALAIHRDMIGYIDDKRRRAWKPIRPRPASSSRIGVMGLGNMGIASIERLRPFGFPLRGWSRSRRDLEGVETFAGWEQLPTFLAGCDILICLVPFTPETRHVLRAEHFSMLPKGAALVNVGRGGHMIEADLLNALSDGQISQAVLDVFADEPLPIDHPFWDHPRILMTPHIGSTSQSSFATAAIVENIKRHRSGRPMIGVIDRSRGY